MLVKLTTCWKETMSEWDRNGCILIPLLRGRDGREKTFNRHKLDHRKQIFLFLLLVHIHRKQIEISGVNFINVLRAAFTLTDPKSVKIHCQCNWIFTFLGSACIKAVGRTLMKLTPDVCSFAYLLIKMFCCRGKSSKLKNKCNCTVRVCVVNICLTRFEKPSEFNHHYFSTYVVL